ncbi:MAG: HDIG domain-containing protein [Clostridiales bacterium]
MKKHNNSFLWRGKIFSKKDIEKLKKDNVWIWWVAMIMLTAFILVIPALGTSDTYNVGEICDNTIYYEGNTLSYMSDVKYQQAKDAVEDQLSPVYVLDAQKIIDAKGRISNFVGEIAKIQGSKDNHNPLYQSLLGNHFSEKTVALWEAVDMDKLYQLESDFNILLNELYDPGVKESDFKAFLKNMDEQISEGEYSTSEKAVLHNLVDVANLEPNNIYDKEATMAIIKAKQDEIKPIEVTVRPGQILVQRGTTITDEQVEMLDKTGLLVTNKNMLYFPGIMLFTLIIYYLIYLYCRRFFPEYAYGKQGVPLLCSFLVMFILICQGIIFLSSNMTGVLYSVLGYLLPLPALAIIFTTLTNQRFSYFLVSVASVFVALLTLSQPAYFIVSFISAIYTVHIVDRIRERYHLISFGFYIGIINVGLIIAVGLIGGQGHIALLAGAVIGMISGFVSSLLALGVLPLAETFFKMTTPMKLLELANPGHPLIKRLMTEAPGTYYHSVLVGNLAEVAADAIGADSNLVRVASYFHDVGKLERPKYFVENQEPNMNPHEKLNPSLSTLIIISHVKDGVEMAEDYDLPQSVVDIINEHHGNSVVQYFYHKAKAASHGDPVHKDDFRYPHPKPQTKESAILMMADSVQAALQSATLRSKGDMRAKIHDIIQNQLAAGQFEECDLTFRDLHKVQEAFFSVLSGLSHYRIEYPSMSDLDTKELVRELAAKKKVAVADVAAMVEKAPPPHWIVPEEGIEVEIDAPKITDIQLPSGVFQGIIEEKETNTDLKESHKNEN